MMADAKAEITTNLARSRRPLVLGRHCFSLVAGGAVFALLIWVSLCTQRTTTRGRIVKPSPFVGNTDICPCPLRKTVVSLVRLLRPEPSWSRMQLEVVLVINEQDRRIPEAAHCGCAERLFSGR